MFIICHVRFKTKMVVLKNSLCYYVSAEIDMLWILCILAAVIFEHTQQQQQQQQKKKKPEPVTTFLYFFGMQLSWYLKTHVL